MERVFLLPKGRQGSSSCEYCPACDRAGLRCRPHLAVTVGKKGEGSRPSHRVDLGKWRRGDRALQTPSQSTTETEPEGQTTNCPNPKKLLLNLFLLHLNMLHQLKLKGFIQKSHLTPPNSSFNTLLLPTLAGKSLLPPSLTGTQLDTDILLSPLLQQPSC